MAPHIETQALEVDSKMKHVFSILCIHQVVRSDNGICFVGSAFREFADDCGFVVITSIPIYPCSNGLAEKVVKTVKRLWAKGGDRDDGLLAYITTHPWR